MLDYFNSYPTADCDPYVDYISKQAYSGQGATNMGAPGGWPEEKMIYLEAFHQKPDGGYVWTYARWEPTTGHKGGVGSYSTRFNYNQTKNGVPYQAIRESIQIMNPALHN